MIIDQAQTYRDQIVELLVAKNLPAGGLPEMPDKFIVAIQDGSVVGVGGITVYGNYGLLRSLALYADHRGTGIAGKLLTRLGSMSKKSSLSALYPLTETASAYFERKKYIQTTRASRGSGII